MTDQPSSVLSRELLPASISIFCTAALASFQTLGIAAALPDIAGDLGDVSLLPWVITVFLLTSSLATVVAGPFIDAIGVSKMFRLSVVIFTIMGFAAAFAPSMAVMVAIRAMQGIGAGLILSTGNAAISLVFPEHLVGRAFAANAMVWGAMGIAGPAVAASILTFLTWQWIFYVNLPLGLIALVAGWRVLPGPFGAQEEPFDLRGTSALVVLTVATLFAVDALSAVSLIWLAGAAAAGAAYVFHARRSTHPVVKLEHIVHQPYRGLGVSTGLLLTGTFAMNSYIPLYMRAGRGASAGLTAWSVLPLTVGWTVGAIISSRMADRHSESWIITVGFLVNVPAMILSLVLIQVGASLIALFSAFFVAGIGVGMATNAALTLLRAVTDPAHMGRVGSAHLFARNQGFTFGAAIGGAILLFMVTRAIGDIELVRQLLGGDAQSPLPGAATAVRDGFAAAVGFGCIASGLGLIAALDMRRALRLDRRTKRGV